MKIFYFDGTKDKQYSASNFGDELNPWLWTQLIPNLSSVCKDTAFVGIGTLLNQRLPRQQKKIIFGTGAGYGEIPKVDSTWKIYFVRGKLTAKVLEIDPQFAITDSAILIRKVFKGSGQKKHKKSFMPHYMEAVINGEGWRQICEDLDIQFIDPTGPLEDVLTRISETEILFTEAMHGAIIADALRTPWVALKTHSRILEFKWNDWLSMLDIPYQPFLIRRKASVIETKSFLKYIDYQLICAQMKFALRFSKPSLSSSSKMNELEEKATEQLEKLKSDIFNDQVFRP